MAFVPIATLISVRNNIERRKKVVKTLLQNQGVNMMFTNVKGSDIGIIRKIVDEFEIDDNRLKNIIPQDKEILSIQIIPCKVSYNSVDEWLLVIVYRK